ncbi:MAG TPA: hypothetical protein VIH71_18330, partial [Solirubrobacteraceae bacterium]
MRTVPLPWHRLRWPREVTPEQIGQAFHVLATVAGWPVVVESVGRGGRVEHRLAVPVARAAGVIEQLQAAIPGLAVEAAKSRPPLDITHALELRLSTRRRPLRTDDLAGVSRTIVTA